jgi:hypothetical protein
MDRVFCHIKYSTIFSNLNSNQHYTYSSMDFVLLKGESI